MQQYLSKPQCPAVVFFLYNHVKKGKLFHSEDTDEILVRPKGTFIPSIIYSKNSIYVKAEICDHLNHINEIIHLSMEK